MYMLSKKGHLSETDFFYRVPMTVVKGKVVERIGHGMCCFGQKRQPDLDKNV